MFTPSIIQTCLQSLVGFPQTYLKDYSKIDADLVTSNSGVMIDQSAHPLLTLENITASAKDYLNTEILDYSSGTTYAINEVVNSGNIIYYSLQNANLNHTPASSSTYWQPTTLVSFYLRRIMKGAALNLFNNLFTQKKLYEAAKTLLTDVSLYDGVGSLKNTVTKLSRFVGFKIIPKSPDTVITISSMGFQLDTVNPTLPIYVYHGSQTEPVLQFNINVDKATSFTWKTLETAIKLYYNNESIGDGGVYYIGYYEDDLTGKAIWRQTTFNTGGCSSCNQLNNYLFTKWSKFVGIQPFYVENANLDEDKNIFDTDKTIDLSNQNWGLNLKIQVQCDVSNVICRNKYVFTNAYKTQIVRDLLNDMAYSVRDNQLKQKVQQMAMLALKGDKQDYSKGVDQELCDAIKAVSFDFSDMNSACIPCGVGGAGVEISSMY
jgi:hypothetical protein